MWVEPSFLGTIPDTVYSCQDLFGQYGYDLLLDRRFRSLFLPDPSRGILHVHDVLFRRWSIRASSLFKFCDYCCGCRSCVRSLTLAMLSLLSD